MTRRRKAGTLYDPNDLLKKNKLHTDEAAFLLEVSPRTVERYLTEGKLNFIRTPGGQRRVLTDSIRKYI
jgi:excisionase family DNA binding protein